MPEWFLNESFTNSGAPQFDGEAFLGQHMEQLILSLAASSVANCMMFIFFPLGSLQSNKS